MAHGQLAGLIFQFTPPAMAAFYTAIAVTGLRSLRLSAPELVAEINDILDATVVADGTATLAG
jgi:hypothetical protein